MIKKLFLFLTIIFVVFFVSLATVLFLISENAPLVAERPLPQGEELTEIRNIIRANKPAEVLKNKTRTLHLTTNQLNQVMAYASQHFHNAARVKVTTDENRLRVQMSYRLPENPLAKYLNVSSVIRVQYSKRFVIESLKLGRIKVPSLLITTVQPLVLKVLNKRYGEYTALWQYLRRIDLTKNDVTIHYRLERSDLANIKRLGRKVMVNSEMKQRLLAYVDRLDSLLNALQPKRQSLIYLLRPVFQFAEQRSANSEQAIEENKMALLVLGSYMTGRNPAKYISDKPAKAFKKIKFTLRKRHDLAKHYLISGALNALSGTAWSNAIGVDKEMKDSDGGSGFSFVDLMADIAGNKLAQAALSTDSALKIQSRLANLTDEKSIMGEISGLPEGLTKKEFILEYGNSNSDEYMTVIREIERRLYHSDAYR